MRDVVGTGAFIGNQRTQVDAACNGASWMHLLRGGRIVKWKGQVASCGPSLAEGVTRVVVRALGLSLAIGLAAGQAAAADFYWDTNGTAIGRGGSGNWDLTSSFWSPSGDGVSGPYSAWSGGALDHAFFGGTAGTVTLASPITVNGLTFDAPGYTLTGGALTLAGASPTISTIGANTGVDIHSTIAGSAGLTKAGAGVLRLHGANTFTGAINLDAGTIDAASDAALGAASNNIFTGAGAAVGLVIAGADTNRTVTIGDGGRLYLQGSGAGSALVNGNGQVLVGTGVTMGNDASTYTGSTTFRGVNGVAYSYFTSIGNLGEASSLGAPTTVSDGTIVFDQSSQYSDNVVYLGDGDSSNRNWELYGEAANIRNQGTGTLSITGDVFASDSSGFLAEGADIELLGTLSGGDYLFSGNAGRAITLGGANTYTGTTSINAVTVRASVLADAGVASSFGTGTEPISIANNGALSYTGTGGGSNRQWTIASAASFLNDGSGALALSGAVDLGAVAGNSLALGGSYGGTSTLSGVVSGTGDLISKGAGTWVLGAANTRTGAIVVDGGTLRAGNASAFGTITGVTVNGGTLDLGGFDLTAPTLEGTGGTIALGANTLTVDTETDASYAGGITGSGGLAKTGLGTLTLTGANTYTGDTSLSGGGLALDFSAPGAPATNIIAAASTLDMAGGRLNLIGAGGSASSQSFDGLNVTAGSSRIAATSGAGGSMTVNFGAITRSGGLVDFALPTAGSFTTTSASLGGWATVNGVDYAKVEAGVITAFTAADYANKDDAGNWLTGEVISDVGGTVDTPFFGTVASSQQLGGLKYTAAAESTVNIATGQTLGIDGTIIVASSVGTVGQAINGGSLTGGAGGGTLGILHNGEGPFGIASTIIDNGGATGFTKGGTGLVSLAGANTYTGATTLSGGTLQVTSLANGGVASNIGASTADSANLVIESGTLHYVGGADASTDRGFTLVNGGASAPTIQVDTSRTVEFSGRVTSPDDAGLTKTGWGTLVLSNVANDYVGVTTVTGSGAGGSSTLSVNTLANGGVASGIGAASSDSGNIVLSEGGRLQYTGGTVGIDRGFTLAGGNGRIDVAQATTTLTVSGLAVGAGRLVKEGGGTLVLSGANAYTGGTAVNGGILRAGSGQAFGDPMGLMTVNGSGTLDLGGFDITIGGLLGTGTVDLGSSTLISSGLSANGFSGRITGTGGFTRSGGWTQTLGGCQNDYTGVTTIEGRLNVDCLADGGVASGIGASGSDAANLVFKNGRLGYTGGSATTDRGFTLQEGNGTISVSEAATTLEFTGQVVGTGRLVKGGAGTLVLSGNNTYSGGTEIGAGILRANSSSAFGGLSGVVFGGAVGTLLDLNGFDTHFTYLNGGSDAGGDIALGGATMTLGGAIGYAEFAGVITGAGALVMDGANTQRLGSCDSDYTGSTTITSGTLEVACLADGGVASSIGVSSADAGNLVLNGGWLSYTGTGSSTDRQLTLGASTNSALVAAGTGAIEFTSTAPVTFSVADSAQTLRLTGGNTDDNRFAAGIADNGTGVTSLIKSGDGTWILTNPASTYTGVTTIVGGVLGVDKLADGGMASSLGASSADASNLVIGNGSTLRYTGTGDSTNRLFTLAAGTTLLESSGTGAIVFTDTGPLTLAGNNQNRTIALGGTNTGNNTLSGSIGDAGTGATILAKNNVGTWVLTGDSTYTGNTVVNGGTLVLGNGGTSGSIVSDDVILSGGALAFDRSDDYVFGNTISGAGGGIRQMGPGTTILTADNRYGGATQVDAGTLLVNGDQSAATGTTTVAAGGTLGGTGIIGGDVAVVGGTIAAGNSPGTLTINGNFALDADSTLAMEFGEANVSGGALNDLIDVGGDLTLDGTLDVTESAGGDFGAGIYRVVNYDGGLTDNGLLIGALPGGTAASDVFIQTSVAQQVNLVNTNGLTLNFWDGAAGPTFDDLINGGNGSWQNSAGNHNWTEASGAINAGYSDGAYAIFSGAAGIVTVDNSLGAVSASAMQFATDGYRIEGDPLVLLGSQSIIRVGDGTAAGAGITATIASELTGATELLKTDAGTLVLTGASSYTGGTGILGGTLQVAADASLGATSGGLSFDGGTLHTTADIVSARAVTLAGDGVIRTDAGTQLTLSGAVAGAGTLTKDGAGSLLLLSDAAHSGGTTIAQGTLQLGDGGTSGGLAGDVVDNGLLLVDRSDARTLDGVISGSGAFTQAGTGTTTLSGANSYAGATRIDAGTLLINGNQSAATGTTTVAAGGTLGGTGTIGGDVAVVGGTVAAGNSPGTLTVNGNFSLDANSTLAMEFGEANVAGGAFNDLIDVGGDLTLDGTLDVTESAGGEFGAGIYRVFNYGGTLIDNELALGQMPAGSETFIQTSVAGQVNLVNGAGLTLNYWDGAAGPKFDHAIAGGDGTWQNSLGNDNWTDAAGDINAAYNNGSFAIFTGTAGTVTVDTGLGQVEATGMQFAVDGYRVEGGALALTGSQSTIRVGDGTDAGAAMTATIASDLSGSGTLVKTDLGTLVLAGANSYTGGTAINGGTLQVAADTALGDTAGALSFDGGTLHTTADMGSDRSLAFTGEGTLLTDADTRLALGGALSGTGAFHKTGEGTLLLTGDSGAYAGAASVDAGTLVANGILGGSLAIGEQGRLEGSGRVGATGNRGVIAPGSVDAFGTLSIQGDYAGDGGRLEIAAALGDDSSATSRLVVDGATWGSTQVDVVNRGGLGGLTREGIKIVDVAGASNGTFALDGDYVFQGEQVVVAGALGYRLYQGGTSTPTDGDWYLRSTLLDPSAPGEPGTPEEPGTPPPPLYQPGVPIYESYAGSLQESSRFGTLQQRTGNRLWAARIGDGSDTVVESGGALVRIEGRHAEFEPEVSTSSARYDADTWKLQFGVDTLLAEYPTGSLVGGFFAHYGTTSSQVRSPYGVGDIETTGQGLSAAVTWYGRNGVYVDGQMQFTLYDSDLHSATAARDLATGVDGQSHGISIEAGRRFALSGNWSLTPQGQLAYTASKFEDFADVFDAHVSLDDNDSLRGRAGIAANYDVERRDAKGQVKRTHLYGIANLYYDFADGSKIEVAGTTFSSRNERLYGEIGAGGSFNWADDRYSLYGELSHRSSLQGSDDNAVGGTIGFRVRW